MRICKLENCERKHHGKGYCRKHYVKLCRDRTEESRKRYEKVKNDPKLYAVLKKAQTKYRKTDKYKKKKKKHDKKYYLKNKNKIRKYRQELLERKRFGDTRETILKRFNNACVVCGNTEQLVIHHKDHVGRNSDKPNNDPDNLTVLCRACHMIHHLHKRVDEDDLL